MIIDQSLPTLTDEVEAALADLPRQRALFVRHYITSLDIPQAYVDAGYAESGKYSNSYRIMQDERVINAIDLALELKVDAIAISADVIEQEYWSLYKEARHNKDRATARQCLRDLGQHHAMFIELKGQVNTDQIEARLSAGRERVAKLKHVNGTTPSNGESQALIEHETVN